MTTHALIMFQQAEPAHVAHKMRYASLTGCASPVQTWIGALVPTRIGFPMGVRNYAHNVCGCLASDYGTTLLICCYNRPVLRHLPLRRFEHLFLPVRRLLRHILRPARRYSSQQANIEQLGRNSKCGDGDGDSEICRYRRHQHGHGNVHCEGWKLSDERRGGGYRRWRWRSAALCLHRHGNFVCYGKEKAQAA